MYDQLLQLLSDIFGKIKISIKNLNLWQKGEVVFDFNGKNTINVGEGWVTVEQLNTLLWPTGTVMIDGSRIIDSTLDASLKLTDRTINEVKIELGSIKDELVNSLANLDGSKFLAGSVTTTQLYAGAVNALKISAINIRADQAVITGTIQIADAIITNAKIADLSVAKLTAGTITSQNIVLAGTGYIQSSGYVAGSTGWRISSDGTAEFRSITARGNIQASSATFNYAGSSSVGGNATLANDTNAVNGVSASSISQGAGRANNAINASNRYAQWLQTSELSAGSSPSTGVIIDSSGIRGYKAGTKNFEITSAGDAFFNGTIGASTITATVSLSGGTIQTGTSGQRIVIDSTTMKFYNTGGTLCGTLYGFNGSYGAVINADSASLTVDKIIANQQDAYFCAGGTTYTARFLGKMRIPVWSNLY